MTAVCEMQSSESADTPASTLALYTLQDVLTRYDMRPHILASILLHQIFDVFCHASNTA